MPEDGFCVVLFKSSGHAVQAERKCKKAGINVRLIPVPREISSDCGVCLRIHSVDKDATEIALSSADCEFEGILHIERS